MEAPPLYTESRTGPETPLCPWNLAETILPGLNLSLKKAWQKKKKGLAVCTFAFLEVQYVETPATAARKRHQRTRHTTLKPHENQNALVNMPFWRFSSAEPPGPQLWPPSGCKCMRNAKRDQQKNHPAEPHQSTGTCAIVTNSCFVTPSFVTLRLISQQWIK